jgi:hypothetical protein
VKNAQNKKTMRKLIAFIKKLLGLSKPQPTPQPTRVPTPQPTTPPTQEYYYLVENCETSYRETVISFVEMQPNQSFFFKYNKDQAGCYRVIKSVSEAERILPRTFRVFNSCEDCQNA